MSPAEPIASEKDIRTTPIFVLGLQRSGTTWLANMLCKHAACAGIQSDDHDGIHESVFFSHFSRSYGDLTDERNFQRFAHDFARSDYFLLSKLSPRWFADLQPRNYGAIFYDLMEQVAIDQGATHWVEKSPHHSLLGHELATLYPHAKFVCLIREPSALIPSLLNAPWRPKTRYPLRALMIVRSCMTYRLYSDHLNQFARTHANAMLLRYEDLHVDCESELKKLCLFLGLPYQNDMLDVQFRRNSSFRSKKERSQATSRHDRLCIATSLAVIRLVPHRLLNMANRLKQRIRPEPWPNWVWRRCPLEQEPPIVNA